MSDGATNRHGERMLTTREVAEHLGISRWQVTALIRRGHLPAVRINARVYRVAESDLRTFILNRKDH